MLHFNPDEWIGGIRKASSEKPCDDEYNGNIYEVDFVSINKHDISINSFNPILNCSFKPKGGLWASEYNKEYISTWYQFIMDESGIELNIPGGVIFNIYEGSNIYIVNNIYDYKKLIDIVGTDSSDTSVYLDYANMELAYDGIYFTPHAVADMGNSLFYGKYKGVDLSLYGYDTDSLILFNIDCITNKRSIRLD